ncbi:MAG: glycosyltransferase [Candidatus Coatesbacteria bacterium]|nr:glycosyltransferase [Candidatus Coatesbacteria bacterium]
MEEDVFLSCIIPVKNGHSILPKILPALKNSCNKVQYKTEIIVVDNDSTDGTADLMKHYPVKLFSISGGVSKARNYGAKQAKGKYILFLDSDILVNENTISQICKRINNENCDGLVGLLSLEIPYSNEATIYKNLWMHYTYSVLPDFISGFYTSFACIKRSLFMESKGFNENYTYPSVEDTVLGRQFARMGAKILNAKDIQVIHLKEYSTWSVLKLDFRRSASLVKVILREKLEKIKGASVPYSFMFSVPLPFISLVAFILIFLYGLIPSIIFTVSFSLIYALNDRLLSLILKNTSYNVFFWSLWFLPLDLVFVELGIIWGLIEYLFGKKY